MKINSVTFRNLYLAVEDESIYFINQTLNPLDLNTDKSSDRTTL